MNSTGQDCYRTKNFPDNFRPADSLPYLTMNRYLLLAAGLVVWGVSAASDAGVPIQVAGGTVAEVPAKTRGRLDLTGSEVLLARFDKNVLRID